MYCCIRSCSARWGKSQVSFHRFPQNNEVRRQRWIEAAQRGSEINYDYAMICSRHFENGKPSRVSDCEAVNWVPTLLLDSGNPEEDWRIRRKTDPSSVDIGPTKEIDDDTAEVRCAVRGCGMAKEENPTLLFFPVPSDPQERSKWLLQIGMLDKRVKVYKRQKLAVCELHFELSRDLLNYDDVITMGRPALLRERVMPTRNIPIVFGHQPVRYSNEPQDSAANSSNTSLLGTSQDDNSLLQEMVPKDSTISLNPSETSLLEHYQATSPMEEFVEICRACLSTDKATLISAFEGNLAGIFFQMTNVNISENEGISTMLCLECKNRLLELSFFRDSCLTNTQILIHRYQKCYGLAPHDSEEVEEEENYTKATEADNAEQLMKDVASENGNDSVSNDTSHHEVRADDPEDLLVPQKEELEDWGDTSDQPSRSSKSRPRKTDFTAPEKPQTASTRQQSAIIKPIRTMKKKFSCKICRKEYNSKPGYDIHMNTHKGEDPAEYSVECKRCHILRKPTDRHGCFVDIVYCHICAEKFRSWSYLKIHLAKTHKIKTKRRELMLKLMANDNKINPTEFLKTPPKIRASPKRPSQQVESASSSEEEPASSPWWRCGFCTAVFKHPSILDAHVKTHSAVQLTRCNECEENFENYKQLEKHHDTHDNPSGDSTAGIVIRCAVCAKQFQRRQTLFLHRQYVHADKEVVQCSSCARLFVNAKALSEHKCATDHKPSQSANGDFVIVRPESIMQGSYKSLLDEDNSRSASSGGGPEENTDPLLGLRNEEVITLESDDDDDNDESSKDPIVLDCTVCGKTFEKADVFDRHMKLHRMMSAAKGNAFGHKK